jgi:hypothetical protein
VVCYVEVKNAADGGWLEQPPQADAPRPRAGFNHRAAETVLPPLAVVVGIAAVLAAVVYLDRTLLEQTRLPAQAHNS